MKLRFPALILGLLLIAPCQTRSGEQPRPGLEVFDAGAGTDASAGPGVDYFSDPFGDPNYQPEYNPDQFSGSVYPDTASDPFPAPDVTGSDYVDPTFTEPASVPVEPTPAPDSHMYPADPVAEAIADLNIRNPHFPGLAQAAATGSLEAVAPIIWEVLKARRVVATTMERGPGGSAGITNPYDMQRVFEIANYRTPDPTGADSPLAAARRINSILDAFAQPTVADYSFGGMMPAILLRLHSDIYAVRVTMAQMADDGAYLEMAQSYLRAASTCDFFIFPSGDVAFDIDAIMARSERFFYPDGASIAGDVAGVTGSLFETALSMSFYTRDDSRFRQRIGRLWRGLEIPARYVLDLALPDMSIPKFGPRGARELGPLEVSRLNELFPRRPHQQRIGLAASQSFPSASTTASYGGIFATRSGPESDARYLAVRFGPLGIMPGVPSHLDFGALVLMSRNIKFLVDAGGFDGASVLAQAHSVLSLDNQFVIDTSYPTARQPVNALWRTNASMDYVTGLAGFADGKTWQRSVVYVKDLPGESLSDYWLVLDDVDMKGDPQPRQARIRFQMAPGIQAYNDGSGIVASAGYMDGSSLRIFAIDPNAELTISEGDMGLSPSYVFDNAGGTLAAPSVTLSRTLVGNSTTTTLLFPAAHMNHRPVRLERDSDIIRGRTGAVIIDHGRGRIDVVAWAPPGTELVTPTLNLQMSADLAVFRLRNGKFVRVNFVNLEHFQAKEPDGGVWSMRVSGPAQTLTLEPERGGGWQILSDPANESGATLYDATFGPGIDRRRFAIRPGELRIVPR